MHKNTHYSMVTGLKAGNRVQAQAVKVLGKAKAKLYFPDNWQTAIMHGLVQKKGRGRSVIVLWDNIDETCNTATRLLQRDEPAPTDASASSSHTAIAEGAASAAAMASTTTIVHEDASVSTDVIEDGDFGAEDPPINPAFDEAEAAAALNPGDELLRPHNCAWKVVESVTVDVDDRAKMSAHIRWGDRLDNDRDPLTYFLHFYPSTHLGAGGTIEATNAILDVVGGKHLTVQEYFLLLGLMLLMSFYPKFSVNELFSKSAPARSTGCISIPLLSMYMSLRRFKVLTGNLTFISRARAMIQYGDDLPAFWQVQSLIDCFNYQRAMNFSPGWKLVVDESMCPWRGKDARFGVDGCPHVTKIARKPKGVGMEIKNIADCDSGIMCQLEIMAPKDEMKKRQFTARYGSGTALLLRLCEPYAASGRVVVADSAFASVKSACALKTHLGLYFHGLVKTAHRMFPKAWLNQVPITERGGHAVVTSKIFNVDLRAVTWNDGKRDKKTGEIMRKNIVASCGTTLPGRGHKKRRWTLDDNQHATFVPKTIPRPQIVEEYFEGAQKIDVHNHMRQGRAGVALEMRPTQSWTCRFHQTFVGICEVDAFLAYRRFSPGKNTVSHSAFLQRLTQQLLDNTIGCAHGAPVLRPRRPDCDEDVFIKHSLRLLNRAPYYVAKTAAAVSMGRPQPQCVLKCRMCSRNCHYYCPECSVDHTVTKGINVLCGPKSGRDCFLKHQRVQEYLATH